MKLHIQRIAITEKTMVEIIYLQNDTVRAIYSFHPDDPTDESSLPYHGTPHRGAKSVMLTAKIKTPVIPGDALTFDFLSDNVSYALKHCLS